MQPWTTLPGKLDNPKMWLRWGREGSDPVHGKQGKLGRAASLWIVCTILTVGLQMTILFLVFMESFTQVIPLTLDYF